MAAKLGHISPKSSPSSLNKRHYTSLDVEDRRGSRIKGNLSFPSAIDMESGVSLLEESLHLDRVGPVIATIRGDRIVWTKSGRKNLDSSMLPCCGSVTVDEVPFEIPVSEIYGVQKLGRGAIHDFSPLPSACYVLGSSTLEMHRFVVHTFYRSPTDRCRWIPKACVFGHSNSEICQAWVKRIQQLLEQDFRRPKKLLVVVNPYGGKGQAVDVWEQIIPLFERAAVHTEVITTQRRGDAFDIMDKASEEELQSRDGVVIVGGDGLFGEVLNGLLARRHKAPPAPKPHGVSTFFSNAAASKTPAEEAAAAQGLMANGGSGPVNPSAVLQPLLRLPGTGTGTESLSIRSFDGRSNASLPAKECVTGAAPNNAQVTKAVEAHATTSSKDALIDEFHEPERPSTTAHGTNLSSLKLRIGLIPAGSTDTIVVSTTGSRDPVTAALHIILGDRMPLDIVRVTGWRKTPDAEEVPTTRYAASFVAYGFYGEVARDSEAYRWMGPTRYDFAGFEVFLRHRKFEADISFLEMPRDHESMDNLPHGPWPHREAKKAGRSRGALEKMVCRMNCRICAKGIDLSHLGDNSDMEESIIPRPRWRTLTRSYYHSIGAAVMSCRNDKAPDGVAAHAHLADGLLHLILIRNCSRFDYLRQLLRLTMKGADPLNFGFVEYHKTPVFTFVSHGPESVWSVDGELFPAHQLTAQVFRGLIDVFARGPEV